MYNKKGSHLVTDQNISKTKYEGDISKHLITQFIRNDSIFFKNKAKQKEQKPYSSMFSFRRKWWNCAVARRCPGRCEQAESKRSKLKKKERVEG